MAYHGSVYHGYLNDLSWFCQWFTVTCVSSDSGNALPWFCLQVPKMVYHGSVSWFLKWLTMVLSPGS